MILAGSRLGVEAPVTFCENPDLLHKDIHKKKASLATAQPPTSCISLHICSSHSKNSKQSSCAPHNTHHPLTMIPISLHLKYTKNLGTFDHTAWLIRVPLKVIHNPYKALSFHQR